MSLEQQFIFLFSALGALNGLLLSGYFLIIKPEQRLSDYFLGGLVLMLSIRILKSVFLYFNPHLFQLFVQIGLSACLLIGPFLYLYVVNMTQDNHNLKKTWWWHLLPFLLIIVWLSYAYPYSGPANSWGPFVEYIYNLWLLCIIAAGYHMRNVFGKCLKRSEKLSDQDLWLLNIFLGVTVIFIAYQTSSYTSYIVGALSFSFLFYLSMMLGIFQRSRRSIASDPPIKYAGSSLSPADARAYMNRLTDYMENQKAFLNPELTLSALSKQLGISRKQLSQAVNQMTDYNFSKYVASLRVEEAKRLLLSDEHQHYKIAAIAYDSGFNSLSSFNDAFKLFTGLTPGEFRKQQEK